MKKTLSILFLFAFVFISCEKVIQLDLISSETKYVLKGEVVAGDSIHHLSITTSIPFDQSNNFPGIDNAIVTLSDNLGNITTLISAGNGDYYSSSFMAYDGRTYTMNVNVDDKVFTSSTTIPLTVPLSGALVLPSSFFGQTANLIVPIFQDPSSEVNFYKFRYFEKDSLINDSGIIISNDENSNGQINQQPFIGGYFPNSGDTVFYQMWGIDQSVYDFYFSKEQNTSGNSGAPANPISNWSGDALGYFTAHNKQEIQIVIP